MSAVIGGFAFSGLVVGTSYTGFLAQSSKGLKYFVIQAFYTSASLSIGFCLLTCVMCTLLNVRGPGLALRGPEGSLKRSVDLMRAYQRHVNTTLTFGIIFFHLTAMTYSWIMLSRLLTTILVTIFLFFFLVQMILYLRAILRDFRISTDGLQQGGFEIEDLVSVAGKTGNAKHSPSTYQQTGGAPPYPESKDDDVIKFRSQYLDAPDTEPLVAQSSGAGPQAQDEGASSAETRDSFRPSIFSFFG
mmetsp:Transcript_24331/g.30458  ORF Transcript_24331/g.30458 Transcript_24331/m.30458 type:complete len:245 (+) Transcript_24331:3-737(+)